MSDGDNPPSQTTAPAHVRVQIVGLGPEFDASKIEDGLTRLVRQIGRNIDLTRLDGVTLAIDYAEALLNLDRGYESEHRLQATRGDRGVGVAMSPTVIRDGVRKSHIVMNANVFFNMLNDGHEGRLIQLLAHECAHVEANAAFDGAIPNYLLGKRAENGREYVRWRAILACWDEYAACRLSARYGDDPGSDYETLFLDNVHDCRERANESIKAYRLHHDIQRVMGEVVEAYEQPLKYFSYYLGNLAGQEWQSSRSDTMKEALADHEWIVPYLQRLGDAHEKIWVEFGRWQSFDAFQQLGDVFEDLLAEGGVLFEVDDENPSHCCVHIPYSPQTMPT